MICHTVIANNRGIPSSTDFHSDINQSRCPFGVTVVQYLTGFPYIYSKAEMTVMTEYATIKRQRFWLHWDHGFTNKEPTAGASPCKHNINGTKVIVMSLFAGVHPFRGFVNQSKSSANWIEHQLIKTRPNHLKCGTPELNKTVIAMSAYNVVLAEDSTL
jgi:hypothetical protein